MAYEITALDRLSDQPALDIFCVRFKAMTRRLFLLEIYKCNYHQFQHL